MMERTADERNIDSLDSCSFVKTSKLASVCEISLWEKRGVLPAAVKNLCWRDTVTLAGRGR